jgi:uncharacterized protein YggE
MKTKPLTIAAIALLLVFSLVAWTRHDRAAAPAASASSALPDSQPVTNEPRTITVSGDAEVRVVPDEVILTLGVQTWDRNLQVAKRQNDGIVERVLDLVADHGIDPQHVQTSYIGIEPRYRNGYYEESDFIGFFVSKTIVITLRDLTKFEDLLAGSLEAGVNYVHGIQFRTTALREHRDSARALAIQAAREKAADLAGELEQRIGDPQSIREEQSGWWSSYNAWWGSRWGNGMAQNVIQEVGAGAIAGEGSVAPGQISVNARVSVTFELAD